MPIPTALPTTRLTEAAMDAMARQDADVIMARLQDIIIPGWILALIAVSLCSLVYTVVRDLFSRKRPVDGRAA